MIRNALQHSENVRNSLGLNYKFFSCFVAARIAVLRQITVKSCRATGAFASENDLAPTARCRDKNPTA